MSFWVYILRCADDTFFIDHTDDLPRLLAEHEMGELPGYTATRRPVEAWYAEEFRTRDQAIARQRQVKGWSRARKLALAKRDWKSLPKPARKPNRPSTSPSRQERQRLRSA
jgi:tRNA/rRNA methyltransferase